MRTWTRFALLRHAGLVLAGLSLGCGSLVVQPTSSGTTDASATSTGTGGASPATGVGGSQLADPGVRLSQGEPCCAIHDGVGTCCHQPNGDPPGSSGPWEIVGIDDAVEAVFGGHHACVRHATGKVACWGSSEFGELGLAVDVNGTAKHPTDLPQVQVTRLATSERSICGIEPSGQAICWGQGLLGAPSGETSQAPVHVPGASHVIDIAMSLNRACAVGADGSVLCWGSGAPTPVAVEGLKDAVKVAVCEPLGDDLEGCAVRADGTVACWGNWGSAAATPVPGLEGVVQLGGSVFGSSICARTGDGRIFCLSATSVAGTPVSVTPIDVHDAIDMSAGYHGVCAARSSGSVACWTSGGVEVPFPLN